ncbi:sporulation protein [Hymenobacter busanensis]|uniref:Sporulation protein n=1 Tax=Hymenobacter busanensis TaxID=2607656 RepID=A0A7L5A1T3_9BACT|nr:SPOR domain-containing protein [Hymenobacter busanensis]KAA9338616.1 sporulation protein [Hymenobacter busanensis]QHJ08955.1 sporulation protein [Hymenobacter busanensis]
MNRLLTNLLVLPALLLLGACAASTPAATATTAPPDTTRPASAKTAAVAAEDLSKYRPVFTPPALPKATTGAAKPNVTPTAHVNALIDQRLRDQAYTNQNVKYTNGWRILVYIGLERQDAMNARRAIISRYPQETDYLTFKQPLYRLFIGDYTTRLEAEQAMLRLRPLAPKAEMQATQVLINKTRF